MIRVLKIRNTITILLLGLSFSLFSQTDSAYIHSRKKAAILSASFPGLGQFYNEFGHRKVQGRKNISWWRAPIFLGGLAYTAYFGYVNADSARIYREEWEFKDAAGDESVFLYPKFEGFSKSDLQQGFQLRVRNRDYAIAGFALIYALNVIDAFVDAHFVTFDVTDDLSLSFKPKYYGTKELGGSLILSFK